MMCVFLRATLISQRACSAVRSFQFLGFRSFHSLDLNPYKHVNVVSVPFDGGQGKKGPALAPAILFPHVQSIAAALSLTHSHSIIGTPSLSRLQSDSSSSNTDSLFPKSKIKQASLNGTVCQDLAKECRKLAQNKNGQIIILGGDHSIATGSIAGIGSVYPNLGVIWVDAHADLNSHMTSLTGNVHGMPVGFLLGLDNSQSLSPYSWLQSPSPISFLLSPQRIVYIGLRDLDLAEKDFMRQLKIKHFNMSDVDRQGIKSVMSEAIEYLGPNSPLHLSFDIDALDVNEAPSTGTSVPGGLTLREGRHIAESVAETKRLVGLDLVEVNPLLGKETDVERTVYAAKTIISFAMGCQYV